MVIFWLIQKFLCCHLMYFSSFSTEHLFFFRQTWYFICIYYYIHNRASFEVIHVHVGGLTENDFILAAKINELNVHGLLRRKASDWESSIYEQESVNILVSKFFPPFFHLKKKYRLEVLSLVPIILFFTFFPS